MTSYKVQVSGVSAGVLSEIIMEFGGTRVFTGNTDRDSVVVEDIYPPIATQIVRIVPLTWYGHPSLRFEIYGCDDVCDPLPTPSGGIVTCDDGDRFGSSCITICNPGKLLLFSGEASCPTLTHVEMASRVHGQQHHGSDLCRGGARFVCL